MSVRYAVGLPNVGEFGDPGVLVELAVLAEEHGWDGVYLWDHVLFHDPAWPVANPTVTAAAIAAVTDRIRLIVVCVLPRRRVQVVARESVSLDVLSGGRLTMVAAIGSLDREYSGFGESAELKGRGAALDTRLADLRALWTAEPAVVSGGSEPVRMVPPPIQLHIPIWCGGRWPNRAGMRRAARFDGAMPTFVGQTSRVVTPAELGAAVEFVVALRGDLHDFDVVMEGATERPTAAATVASYAAVGLTWWIEAMGWWRATPGGTPGAVPLAAPLAAPGAAVAAARTRILAGPPS
jgi:alkanesulfonate monooxygenase SsuD/methylene tetrahydromethanopterin reductase-like flavin-dependent oxidoreductase (luciferase family)